MISVQCPKLSWDCPCFFLLLPDKCAPPKFSPFTINGNFIFQVARVKSLSANLDTTLIPPQSLSKSRRLYFQNISRHQPLLTISIISSLTQAPTSLAWIISITSELVSLRPSFPAFSFFNIPAKVILFKPVSDHVFLT